MPSLVAGVCQCSWLMMASMLLAGSAISQTWIQTSATGTWCVGACENCSSLNHNLFIYSATDYNKSPKFKHPFNLMWSRHDVGERLVVLSKLVVNLVVQLFTGGKRTSGWTWRESEFIQSVSNDCHGDLDFELWNEKRRVSGRPRKARHSRNPWIEGE